MYLDIVFSHSHNTTIRFDNISKILVLYGASIGVASTMAWRFCGISRHRCETRSASCLKRQPCIFLHNGLTASSFSLPIGPNDLSLQFETCCFAPGPNLLRPRPIHLRYYSSPFALIYTAWTVACFRCRRSCVFPSLATTGAHVVTQVSCKSLVDLAVPSLVAGKTVEGL